MDTEACWLCSWRRTLHRAVARHRKVSHGGCCLWLPWCCLIMSVWLGFAALWAPSFAPRVQSSRNPLADSSVLGSGGQTEKQVNCDAEESCADASFDVKDNRGIPSRLQRGLFCIFKNQGGKLTRKGDYPWARSFRKHWRSPPEDSRTHWCLFPGQYGCHQ